MISRRAKRLTLGFGFLLVLIVLLLFSVQRFFANKEAQRRFEEEQAAIVPRGLYLVKAERREGVRTRRYAARIAPWIDSSVSAEVSGRVEEVFVESGSQVEKGDPLVKLEERMIGIELASADAALESAKLQARESRRLLEEARSLAKRNVISSTEAEARESTSEMNEVEVKRREAERDRIAENLARHTIRAPFSGTVRLRHVDVGDMVPMNGAVVDLVKLDPLRVVFHASAFEVGAFEVGEPVKLTIAGMESRTFRPKITNVSRSADPESRLFRIEATLENAEFEILGGTQGVVEANVEEYPDAVFLPASAVRIQGTRVFVEVPDGDNGETRMKEIRIGQEVDDRYPVVEGMEEGEQVVVR